MLKNEKYNTEVIKYKMYNIQNDSCGTYQSFEQPVD
jgi:hypothetical protein